MNVRRCPYCDSLVDDLSSSCSFCGKEIGSSAPPVSSASATNSGYGSRRCVACGREIPFDAGVCPYCGHDYRISVGMQVPAQGTWKPVVGGVLIIIAGVLAVAMALLMLSLQESDFSGSGVDLPEGYTVEEILGVADVCGVILVAFAVLAVVGGVFGVRRKSFGLAMVGGVFGLLGIGFIVGSVLGLIGLILVAVSRQEFK